MPNADFINQTFIMEFSNETSLPQQVSDENDINYYLWTKQVVRDVWLYGAPFLVVPGVICNILCIAVLRTAAFRQSATGFLLAALAGVDIMCLIVGATHAWMRELMEKDVRDMHVLSCKLHAFFSYVCIQMSSWTLVLVTAERVMSVMMPFHVAIYCTRKRMMIAWLLLTMATIMLYIYLIPTLTVIIPPDWVDQPGRCHFPLDRMQLFDITYWLDMVFTSLLPLFLIVAGNLPLFSN